MKEFTNSKKIFDAHTHVGQFYNHNISPTELKRFLDSVGVECFAASSTTICKGDYKKVVCEIKELKVLCGEQVLPVLWILPQMLNDGGLEFFLDSGVQWHCLKIHPQLHPTIWVNCSLELQQVVSLSSELQIPLLIHSGEKEGCYPLLYEEAFSNNPNVSFILAHGRPVDEAIEMMRKYDNVWVDTAFMPTSHIVKCCKAGFANRVLWGSDYPIPKFFYPNENMVEYYARLLDDLKKNVCEDDYIKLTHTNASDLFIINV